MCCAFYYRNTNGTNLAYLTYLSHVWSCQVNRIFVFRAVLYVQRIGAEKKRMLENPKPVAELPNSGMIHMIVRWDVA